MKTKPGVQSSDDSLPAATEHAPRKKKRLFVAVHGIGDQYRYATIQPVARQITGFCGRPIGLPFGAFHLDEEMTKAYPYAPSPDAKGMGNLFFGEVFWADIHRKAAATGDTIEEEKSWARTVVERLRALDEAGDETQAAAPAGLQRRARDLARRAVKRLRELFPESNAEWKDDSPSNDVDYRKTAAVMSEMIETIATLENFTALAAKAGWFHFNLNTILTDFIGTVQVVAEFEDYRNEIIKRFRDTMRGLLSNDPAIEEIYIISHSEGTVVAVKVLMEILSGNTPASDMAWVSKVRGLMTFGSPLNKHIVMWPELWKKGADTLKPSPDRKLKRPIDWRNYYDYGDPVGFDLEITREWLGENGWLAREPGGVFNFDPNHDYGFTRYPLPGEAHNDYFNDPAVFGHFIRAAVLPEKKLESPPTRQWAKVASLTLPYVICFGLLAAGVYVIYQAALKAEPSPAPGGAAGTVFGLTCLLSGITVFSRIPRLVRIGFWHGVAAGILVLGLVMYHCFVAGRTQASVAAAFGSHGRTLPVVCVALVISLVSSGASAVWPELGMVPLVVTGTLAALMVVWQALTQGGGWQSSLWPLALAALAFAVLWRLAALLFDLSFVWHRYICAESGGITDILKKLRDAAKRGPD